MLALLLTTGLAAQTPPLPTGAVDRLGSVTLHHAGQIAALAFSPDGRFLASATDPDGGSGVVKVWHVATGRLVMRAADGAGGVVFFPDGRRLAGGGRGGVRVYDVATGRTRAYPKAAARARHDLAVSPDGKLLATATEGGPAVTLWDVATGDRVRDLTPPAGMAGGIAAVAFNPDGRSVAAGLTGGFVSWDIATGAAGPTIRGDYISANTFESSPVVFNGTGTSVAVGVDHQAVGLYNPATGGEHGSVTATRPNELVRRVGVRPVARSADGRTLVLVSNGDLKLWDPVTDCELHPVEPARRVRDPIALSRDGRHLAYALGGGIVVEEVATGRRLHGDPATDGLIGLVGFTPAGEVITAAASFRIWDIGPGRTRRGTVLATAEDSIGLSPNAGTAAVGGWASTDTKLINVVTGAVTATLARDANEYITDATFCPDGKRLVTRGTRPPSLWDAATGQRLREFRGHTDGVRAVAVSPDGKRMVTGTSYQPIRAGRGRDRFVMDAHLRVWDLDAGAEVRRIDGYAECLAYSPDGKRIAVGSHSWDGRPTLRLIDAATGAAVRTPALDFRLAPFQVAFSPDGKTLAAAGHEVRLFDLATGTSRRLVGHEGFVFGLAFNAAGTRLVTGGADGLAYVWDVTASHKSFGVR